MEAAISQVTTAMVTGLLHATLGPMGVAGLGGLFQGSH